MCPYTSINSGHFSPYTLTPPDNTRHASDAIRRHQTPPDTTKHAPDTTRHYQICTRQCLIGWHAVVLWWFIEPYSWSRFFLPTGGRADERTKVFQEVLAGLKSWQFCNSDILSPALDEWTDDRGCSEDYIDWNSFKVFVWTTSIEGLRRWKQNKSFHIWSFPESVIS